MPYAVAIFMMHLVVDAPVSGAMDTVEYSTRVKEGPTVSPVSHLEEDYQVSSIKNTSDYHNHSAKPNHRIAEVSVQPSGITLLQSCQ
jgi:hypothetical protein